MPQVSPGYTHRIYSEVTMRDLQNRPTTAPTNAPVKTQVFGLDQNIAGLLCYVPFFVGLVCSIIWVVSEPRTNKFVRFHAVQSLALTAAGFVACLALSLLGVIGLGAVGSILSTVVSLALLGACILCMLKAYKNEIFKLPVVGDFAAEKV
jgi:uncharacterized membrane protein